MGETWTADDLLEMARAYQPACILAAAADLDLFAVLAGEPMRSEQVAQAVAADARAAAVLLDALTALGLLQKRDDAYENAPGVSELMASSSGESVLAMIQHQANCMRRWVHLAQVVKTGRPAEKQPSIRGAEADCASFVGAMDNICASIADEVIADLGPLSFDHLLDIGGALGTWTIAWLRRYPRARATLYDLPHVIPLAEQFLEQAGFSDRVEFAGGDFEQDPLPSGSDLAWVSAIVHQNSRAQNRTLYQSVYTALREGGRILIRDVIMADSRTSPPFGALFAINMLVATQGGATFTAAELTEDLEAAGFRDVEVLRHAEDMSSVVSATKSG